MNRIVPLPHVPARSGASGGDGVSDGCCKSRSSFEVGYRLTVGVTVVNAESAPTLTCSMRIWRASSLSCNSLTRLHKATKSPISNIWEPMWKCSPMNLRFFIFCAMSITWSISCMLIPNLFSASPVVILAWVWAPTLGLIRKATLATLPLAAASSLIISSSGTDSTLKQKMS